ncbi:hypothetical protein D3C85_1850210 [compost metagenome]
MMIVYITDTLHNASDCIMSVDQPLLGCFDPQIMNVLKNADPVLFDKGLAQIHRIDIEMLRYLFYRQML